MTSRNSTIEVFQDLYLEKGQLSHAALRDAVLHQVAGPWKHAKGKEDQFAHHSGGDDMIAFERESSQQYPESGLVLWQYPDGYRVSNIVPCEVGELSYRQYNAILQDFAERIVAPAAEQLGIDFRMTQAHQSLNDWMSAESAVLLKRFSALANKSSAAGHPLDEQRWIAFLISSHKDERDALAHLARWLIEAEGWPAEIAHRLAARCEFSRDLLKAYDESL